MTEARLRSPLVLDTNVVLDLLVFADPAAEPLQAALALGTFDWLATAAMRAELERVLDYPAIRARLAASGSGAARVLAAFDERARMLEAAPQALVRCGDPDDQKFIDLAVCHKCLLLSKDNAVLKLKKRLAGCEVSVAAVLPPASASSRMGA